MIIVNFEKWQALGNDYVIIEEEALELELSPARIVLLCDQHFGIGSDGILLLSKSSDPDVVASLRIFDPDGSEAELSGNGAREAILYLLRNGWTDASSFTLMTASGPVVPTIRSDGTCAVEMGRASTESGDFPSGGRDGIGTVSAGGRDWEFRHVSIGNPQCAIEVGSELEDLDLGEIGPEIENSGLFPNRTNVSFYRVSGSRVRARIFERGVGETLSSGTGASGAAVAAHLGGAPAELTVELDGGELEVGIGSNLDVTLTGWARPVYRGRLSDEMIEALTSIRE